MPMLEPTGIARALPGETELALWHAAMSHMRSLEERYLDACRAGDHDLSQALSGELTSAMLCCDLLLANAVAAARRRPSTK